MSGYDEAMGKKVRSEFRGKGRDARKRTELEARLLGDSPEGRLLQLKREQERARERRRPETKVKVTHNPLGIKLKSRCCRKSPRCINCPIVYARLERSGAWERNDATLAQEIRNARRR